MSQGLKDLFSSERGTFCIVLLMAATALVIAGKLPASDWVTFAKWIAGMIVVSKTVTGAIETIKGSNAPLVAQPTP